MSWRNSLIEFRISKMELIHFDHLLIFLTLIINITTIIFIELTGVFYALFGLLLVLFLPGYLFLAIVFPSKVNDGFSRITEDDLRLTFYERIPLSFGLSILFSPLFGFLITYITDVINQRSVLVVYCTLNFALLLLSIYRRQNTPESERFCPPNDGFFAKFTLSKDNSYIKKTLNILLIISIATASATMAYAILTPEMEPSYTNMAILTENETGELVYSDYPKNISTENREQLQVKIDNHEGEKTKYTLVIMRQKIIESKSSSKVMKEEVISRKRLSIASNETWITTLSLQPALQEGNQGGQSRLTFLLYKGDEPEQISINNSYRHLYLWFESSDSK